MREVCFCGWIGHPSDRRLISTPTGHIGAVCPSCGRVDNLEWLSRGERLEMLQRAAHGAVPAGARVVRELSAV
jgi:hypothetical protein